MLKKRLWIQNLGNRTDDYYIQFNRQRKKYKETVIQTKQNFWEKFQTKLGSTKGNQKKLYRVLEKLRKDMHPNLKDSKRLVKYE